MIQLIAFDADDTLWHNEILYQQVETQFQQILSGYASPETTSNRLFATESRNLGKYGYGIKSFTLSMIETGLELSEGNIQGDQIKQILELGKGMLKAEVKLLEGVESVIAELSQSYDMMVITKGDLLDQQAKVERSGLVHHFRHVEVVQQKDEETYQEVLKRHRVPPEHFLMVGNSLKSDILPVLNLGGMAIYIPYPLIWEHERIDEPEIVTSRFQRLESICDLPKMIQNLDVLKQNTQDPPVGRVRSISIGILHQDGRILVFQGNDRRKERIFYRPLGGGIEFGESSEAALVREIREELGLEIEKPLLLGVLENIFTFEGTPGHEIVFVYEANFIDRTAYQNAWLPAREDSGVPFAAIWLDARTLGPESPPVYPDGLLALLRDRGIC